MWTVCISYLMYNTVLKLDSSTGMQRLPDGGIVYYNIEMYTNLKRFSDKFIKHRA